MTTNFAWLLSVQLCLSITGVISNTNYNDTAAVPLAVVFYGKGQLSAYPNDINWLLLEQCEVSTGNYHYLQLTIIQAENPTFSNRDAFTVLEISSCSNSFASNCIVGVNYVKNGGQVQAFNNITIPYNGSISNLAFRYKSYVGITPITVHVTYVDSGYFSGIYDSTVFATPSVPPNPPTYFGQYVKLEQVDSVVNKNYNYYFFSFCEDDIFLSSKYYSVTIMVASDVSTPLAAFDLVGCSKYMIPDYQNDCTILNVNTAGVVVSQEASSIVSILMDSSQITLSEGIWIGVYGFGGEPNSINNYVLTVQEEDHN